MAGGRIGAAGGSIGPGITTAIVAAAASSSVQFVSSVTDAFTFDLVMAFAATAVAFFGLSRRTETTQVTVAA